MLIVLIKVLGQDRLSNFMDFKQAAAFGTAFVFWLWTEFTQSEEPILVSPSDNDIETGNEILAHHTGELRSLLKDRNVWGPIDNDIYIRAGRLCDRHERDDIFFHNDSLNAYLNNFIGKLCAFTDYVAGTTAPDLLGGQLMTGYKPLGIVSDQEYALKRAQAEKANGLALKAWEALDVLAAEIKKALPQSSARKAASETA